MSFYINNCQLVQNISDPISGTSIGSYSNYTPNGYGMSLNTVNTSTNNIESSMVRINVVDNNVPTEVLSASKTSVFMNVSVTTNTSLNCCTVVCSSEIDTGNLQLNGSLALRSTTGMNIKFPSTYTSAPLTSDYLGSIVSGGSSPSVSLTSNTNSNINSVTLNPGVWFIQANILFNNPPNTTSVTYVAAAISTSPTTPDSPHNKTVYNTTGALFASTPDRCANVVASRLASLTSTTTFYLLASAVFTAGTLYSSSNSTINAMRLG